MIRAEYVFKKTKDEKLDKELMISYVQRMLLSCANLLEKNKKYTLELKNEPLNPQERQQIENRHLVVRRGEFYTRGKWYKCIDSEKLIQENYEKIVVEIEEIKGESDENLCDKK